MIPAEEIEIAIEQLDDVIAENICAHRPTESLKQIRNLLLSILIEKRQQSELRSRHFVGTTNPWPLI